MQRSLTEQQLQEVKDENFTIKNTMVEIDIMTRNIIKSMEKTEKYLEKRATQGGERVSTQQKSVPFDFNYDT